MSAFKTSKRKKIKSDVSSPYLFSEVEMHFETKCTTVFDEKVVQSGTYTVTN